MLVDGGSAINIMPKSTMTTISIKAEELSLSRLLIQGRPWIHANGVVIYGDTKPFTKAESHFANAKFYMDEDMVPKTLPKEIKSMSKATPKKREWQPLPKKQEEEAMPSSSKNDDELAKPTTTKGSKMPLNGPNTPVFRYIPMSRRKNGQSPFETGASKADAQQHRHNLSDAKVARLPQGFIKALPKGVEPSFLPTKRTEKGFDLNAYKLMSNKLMSKVGYDFALSSNRGKKVSNTVKNKKRDLTETQKKLKKNGYGVDNNKAGLGFTPNALVKISSKAKNSSTQHISVSIEQDQEEPKSAPRTSVFDRMNRSRPRISALNRIGGQN
ncbi:hypothetical protein ACFX2K_013616 [Malus domestica]